MLIIYLSIHYTIFGWFYGLPTSPLPTAPARMNEQTHRPSVRPSIHLALHILVYVCTMHFCFFCFGRFSSVVLLDFPVSQVQVTSTWVRYTFSFFKIPTKSRCCNSDCSYHLVLLINPSLITLILITGAKHPPSILVRFSFCRTFYYYM